MTKEIRFAVGSREDVRSSVWRLWANKEDLYLAGRSTAGLLKASFHKSGIYRIAVVSNTPRKPIWSWRRPKETDPGVTPMMTIIVPTINPKERFRDKMPPASKPILFLPAADINSKIIIRIVLTKVDFTESNLRKLPSISPVSIHGYVPLPREIAWLISYYDEFKIVEQNWAMKLIRETKIHLKPGSSKDGIEFAYLHSIEMVTPPFIVDLPLGKGNLDIPQQ